jgi:hypothetical protein
MYVKAKLPSYLANLFSYPLNWFYKGELQRCSSSFFFMGLDLKKAVESHYDVKFDSDFTGMLSEKKVVEKQNTEVVYSERSLCWLGRLDKSSKILILKKLLLDFTKSELKESISRFDIIGDGDAKEELMGYAESLGISGCVCFHGHVNFSDLSAIISMSFLFFAHGTSVYEGVYSNVPVSLVDFYLKSAHLEDMRYEFYAESEGNGFGNVVESIYDPQIRKGETFDCILRSAVLRRPQILEIQSNKLNQFISAGEQGCRALFIETKGKKLRPNTFFFDVLFFKLRKVLIWLRRVAL